MKITCHTKIQENQNLKKKRQPTNANTRMNHMLELSDKDFKACFSKGFANKL